MPNLQRSPKNKNNMSHAQDEDNAPVTREWMKTILEHNNKQFHDHLAQMTATIHTTFNSKIVGLESQIADLKQVNTEQRQKIEHLERNQRKYNIKISQLNAPKEEISRIISTALQQPDLKIRDIIPIKTKAGPIKFIATCNSMDDKGAIMSKKKALTYKGVPFYVNNDLTPKEEEIQYKLRRFADGLGQRGTVAVAYKKVYSQQGCYEFNEATNEIEELKKTDFFKRP